MLSESWRPVVGFDGWYEVSDRGRVRSLTRVISGTKYQGRDLALHFTKTGYAIVDLYRHQIRQTRTVHSLVAEAFIGPRPDGFDVCHGSQGRSVNSVSNLRYGTRSENMQDKKRDGTEQVGERHWNSKLTNDQTREILALCLSGITNNAIAAQFGVSSSLVSLIRHGKRRSQIKGM